MSRRILTSKLSKLSYNSGIKHAALRNCIRCVTVTAASDEWVNAKPYSEIPGPKPWPIPKYGNAWRFSPLGKFNGLSILDVFAMLIKEYGDIVKLEGLGRTDIIIISDPTTVEKVYRNEGPWPVRTSLYVFDYYRKNIRPEVFQGNPGLATLQGEEWRATRTAVNQPYMRTQNFMIYQKPVEEVTDHFVDKMRRSRDDKLELPKDFENEIRKWAIESTGLIAFDERLGCLEDNFSENSEIQKFINAAHNLFVLLYKLEYQPSLWQYYSTKNWKKFVKVMDYITDTSMKQIKSKMEKMATHPAVTSGMSENGEIPSILEVLIKQNPNSNIPIVMAIDTLTAGVDTISNTVANMLYNLSKHPEAQQKLYEELRELLPNKNDKLPKNFENSARYLKACFKESQRVTPVILGNQRDSVEDIVLSGYQIPKQTHISLFTHSLLHEDKSFPNGKKFLPERWLDKTSPNSPKNAHPFTFLPFGFGPRMCIGRRMAELMAYVGMAKIIRNFKISYNYGEMTYGSHILLYPNKPLQFRLEDRED